jgi:cobaltochelatase CobT
MATRRPIAFLSYVRSDDYHEGGRITRFRERLEGEVKIQTGKPFEIFQDRNDIQWGQQWEERINQSLADVTFLIPILTPSFFESPSCRNEFNAFLLRENSRAEPVDSSGDLIGLRPTRERTREDG